MNKRQKKKLLKKYVNKYAALIEAYAYFIDRHPPIIYNAPLSIYMTIYVSMINNEYQKKMYGKVIYPSLGRIMGRRGRIFTFTQLHIDATKFNISKAKTPTKKEIAIELAQLERLTQMSKSLIETMHRKEEE